MSLHSELRNRRNVLYCAHFMNLCFILVLRMGLNLLHFEATFSAMAPSTLLCSIALPIGALRLPQLVVTVIRYGCVGSRASFFVKRHSTPFLAHVFRIISVGLLSNPVFSLYSVNGNSNDLILLKFGNLNSVWRPMRIPLSKYSGATLAKSSAMQ